MSYAQVSDITGRYPSRDLIELTDPDAQAVNEAVITQALMDASSEIDGYLESRFSLPITSPPVVLILLCCDIAMYRMQSLRPLRDIEDARKRYEDVIRKLEKVAKGELTLGLSADNKEPPPASPTVLTQTAPIARSQPLTGAVFTRSSLRAF